MTTIDDDSYEAIFQGVVARYIEKGHDLQSARELAQWDMDHSFRRASDAYQTEEQKDYNDERNPDQNPGR